MTKVGTEALQSLKVETGEMDVKVNGFLCPASKVCYDLEPENILEPPEVCRMAAPNIEQCDMTAAYIQPESLIERSVQLSFTGVPEEDLMITADFSETSLTMEAKLYTSSEDLTPNPLTCEITGRSPKTCTFKVEPKVTEFKILLMALDSASTVDESTVVEFEDFQTRIQQLTSDAIEVRWRASHNQKYDVEIAPEIEGKFSNTSVICGGENPEDSKMCLAYFIGLNLNEDYTASVRAQGDNKYVSASVRMQTVLEKMKPRVVVPLTIKELQKVSREDDPSGRQQNMRVFLDPHEAKDADDFQLSLILASGTGQEAHLLYKIIDGDATEIEFKGNFQDSGCHYKCYERRGYCGIWLRGAGIDRPGFQGGEGWGRQRPVTEGGPRGARPGGSPWEASLRGRLWPLLLRRPERPTVPPLRDLPEIRFCDAVVSEAQSEWRALRSAPLAVLLLGIGLGGRAPWPRQGAGREGAVASAALPFSSYPTEVPALELRNRQELRVQQPRPDGARTEVVVSSDDSILPPDGFGCDDLGDGTCAHPVAVADDLDGFDVTLVVLDDQGYVTASLAVPFEEERSFVSFASRTQGTANERLLTPAVHGVATLSLSQDVLQVAVDPRSGGAYEVTLAGPSPPPAAAQECQLGSPCRVWFAGVDAPPARLKPHSRRPASPGVPGPAPHFTWRQDGRRGGERQHVTRADLVTFSSDVATDADCESLEATSSGSGYSVAVSSRGAGDWNSWSWDTTTTGPCWRPAART
ncbi:hypothetical protein C7M84_002112 [Penaeus vannamei]|uniref:Uncharacterized protein n=1 Tax=Penaeus vannamei TaxID=6689 RepID=A0A423TRW1_PENVA|nr:hypothetical protein C7M84_002112 [Penaeus vannamei]